MVTLTAGPAITAARTAPAAVDRVAAIYRQVLAEPLGFHILLASGELAFFDEHRNLHVDRELSSLFARHNRQFLDRCQSEPAPHRLALLYATQGSRPWGSPTLRFEDWLVRELYPVGGRSSSGLTAFQQRQREHSVYRGLEVILELRHDLAPEAPVYCPVLFHRGTTVADCPELAGAGAAPQTPVVEVLNLFADLPLAQRANLLIQALAARLHHGVIHKDRRRDRSFVLAESRAASAASGPLADAYADLDRDRRLQRAVTLPGLDVRRLHVVERVDSVERWLKLPYQPVAAGRLREFAQFRALDETRLRALATRSLLYTAPAGTRLLERGGRDAWNLYLLEGSLMLTPDDQGATLRVNGGSDRAGHPVAFLKPRKYAVETLTAVSFLWVHDLLLAAVLGDDPRV